MRARVQVGRTGGSGVPLTSGNGVAPVLAGLRIHTGQGAAVAWIPVPRGTSRGLTLLPSAAARRVYSLCRHVRVGADLPSARLGGGREGGGGGG